MSGWNPDEADDPSDWDAFSFLRGLDTSLRCELCFNVLTAPVAVKDCNHVFCSVCVRNAINQPDPQGKHCPKCMRNGVHDSHLIAQPIVEMAAEAWKLARPELVKKQMNEHQRARNESVSRPSLSPETSRPAKRARLGNTLSENDQINAASNAALEVKPVGRVTRSGSHRELSKAAEESIVIDSDTDEDALNRPGSSGSVFVMPSQSSKEDVKDYRSLQANDLASCPLCSQNVTLSVLNQHLDKGCQAAEMMAQSSQNGIKSSKTTNWFPKPTSMQQQQQQILPRIKLARPNYNVMKEPEIRRMLTDYQLSKVGPREKVIERHRQWVTLYNGNLDASERLQKTDVQLRKELGEWERRNDESQRKGKTMTEEAAKAYQEVNKGHFKDLTKSARESHAKNKAVHHQKKTQEEQFKNDSQSKLSCSSKSSALM